MTSKVICMGCSICPVQSAITIIPGSMRCASTAPTVEARNRRSCCAVITAAHGHIDVLPMRHTVCCSAHQVTIVWDIAAGVQVHNLSVRTGRTMPSSPFLCALFCDDDAHARSYRPRYRNAHHGRWPISDTVHGLHTGRKPSSHPWWNRLFPGRMLRNSLSTALCAAKTRHHPA